MRKLLFLSITILASTWMTAQVGINNVDPKATLDITAVNTDPTTPEGLIAPRLTGEQIKLKDAQYTALQTGTIIYATSAATPTTTKTINITSAGYYFFDGSIWLKVASPVAGSDTTDDAWINGTGNVNLGTKSDGTPRAANETIVVKDNGTILSGVPVGSSLASDGSAIITYRKGILGGSPNTVVAGEEDGTFGLFPASNIFKYGNNGGNPFVGTYDAGGTLNTPTNTKTNKLISAFISRAWANNGFKQVARISTFTDASFGNTNYGGSLVFQTASGTTEAGNSSNSSERMRITSSGNVGIGIAAPLNKLHVNAPIIIADMNSGNPLRLEGLRSGAPADEILSVDSNGVVRKLPAVSIGGLDTTDDAWINGTGQVLLGTKADGTARVANAAFRVNDDGATVLGGINSYTPYKLAVVNDNNVNTVTGVGVIAYGTGGSFLGLTNRRGTEAAPLNLPSSTVTPSQIGNLSFNGRLAATDQQLSAITSFYTGDGTTARAKLFLTTAGSGDQNSKQLVLSDNGAIGIGTNLPVATLDVRPTTTNGTTAEGIIAPNLTGDQIKSKDLLYTASQVGAIVYATAAVITSSPKTVNITSAGYYYFNGTLWLKFASPIAGLDTTDDAWVNNGTRVELGTKANGTPRTAGTEFVALDNGNVAIGTNTPAATLDVRAINTDATTAEGFIAPRLTGDQIKSKDLLYTASQVGAIVYATAAVTGTPVGKTINITSIGYYYFTGTIWLKVGADTTDDAWINNNAVGAKRIELTTLADGITTRSAINNVSFKDNGDMVLGSNQLYPGNRSTIISDRRTQEDEVAIYSFGNGLNLPFPAYSMNTSYGTEAAPENLPTNAGIGAIAWSGRVGGSFKELSRIQTTYVGNGNDVKSKMFLYTGGNTGINLGVIIDENNNVGIGNTIPTSKLQVNGSFSAPIRQGSGAVTADDYTIILNGDLTLPPATGLEGRIYNFIFVGGDIIGYTITTSDTTPFLNVNNSTSTFTLRNMVNRRRITVQSSGNFWVIINAD